MTKHYAGVVFAAFMAGMAISSLLSGEFSLALLQATWGLFQLELMRHLIRVRGLKP